MRLVKKVVLGSTGILAVLSISTSTAFADEFYADPAIDTWYADFPEDFAATPASAELETVAVPDYEAVMVPVPDGTETVTEPVLVPAPDVFETHTEEVIVPAPDVFETHTEEVLVPAPDVFETHTEEVIVPAPVALIAGDLADHILGVLTCDFVESVTDCDALAAECHVLNDLQYLACYAITGGDPETFPFEDNPERAYRQCAASQSSGAEVCDATCEIIAEVREYCESTPTEDQGYNGYPFGTPYMDAEDEEFPTLPY